MRADGLLATLSGAREVAATGGQEYVERVGTECRTGEPPERIVPNLDITLLTLHGHLRGGFFHPENNEYCYLQRNIFAGEQLLYAWLPAADQDTATESTE